jgi:hypothetical protein
MATTTYTAHFLDDNGTDRLDGQLVLTDAAAAAPTDFALLNQLTSALTVTAGALPQLAAAWVSGTAKVNPVARQIVIPLEITADGTNNVATCAVAISADNSTYTTVATVSLAAAVNNTGAITLLSSVTLPAGWYIKLTLSHTTVTQSYYY